ncbi:uncharacterized protein LOC123876389 isoform X2 [Maniola jurtina]|uniref:uncharacterized protein LOC123876389 isoform X2 n=1 Tax=Maniola jurtina TaxID=191418 RepID=UPI001E6891B7|nr:uncharacterized protein LOC123876389 isoform X2 [Maniola jurtina]
METGNKETRKTTAPLSLKKQMIIRIHQFLLDEYKFIRLHNVDHCTISPLACSMRRTAHATGVTPSYVSRLLAPYKDALRSSSSQSRFSKKEAKCRKKYVRKPNDKEKRKRNIIKNKAILDSSEEEKAINKAHSDIFFTIKQEPLDNEQETSGVEQVIPSIEQEILDIKQETLHIEEDISDIEQETPGIKQEVPSVEQEILDIKQETLDIEEDVSDLEQETPGFKQEILDIKQEILDIKQETLDKEDILDVEQKTQNVQKEIQDIKQKTNDKEGKICEEIDFEKEINTFCFVKM